MKHFYRTQIAPAEVVEAADAFFSLLGMTVASPSSRERRYQGVVGTPAVPSNVRLVVRPEGGHYTFVDVETDQIGESRIDRNVKRFFVQLHRQSEPRHRLEAAY